jgi:hypothetical protein
LRVDPKDLVSDENMPQLSSVDGSEKNLPPRSDEKQFCAAGLFLDVNSGCTRFTSPINVSISLPLTVALEVGAVYRAALTWINVHILWFAGSLRVHQILCIR